MLRQLTIGLAGVLALAAPAFAASDTLMPPGFFHNTPTIDTNKVGITADQLTYDADRHLAIATGEVVVTNQGSTYRGDRLVFDQRAHTAHFVGHVTIDSDTGDHYTATDLQLSSALQQALASQLTLTTKAGALITAANGDIRRGSGDDTTLEQATYSPCGQCIDSKGRHIGWSVKSAKMIYHGKTEMITLDQPSLYLLGVPVAWLPWLSLPDPTKRINSFRMPSVDYSSQFGARVNAPYFIAASNDDDIILTPSLMSKQGFLMAGEWDHRFQHGGLQVKVSGISQRDPSAFAAGIGDRQWRGALQTSGHFEPVKSWTVGWSYTAFSDPAYLIDYHFRDYTDTGLTNEVYATHLAGNEFIDFRLQQFNLLGNVKPADQAKQADALPNAHYRNVLYLPHDLGEIDLSADLIRVTRGADDTRSPLNSVPYNFGLAEAKTHGTVEADWQKRYIVPGGFAVTPFVGLRADAAYYDGTTSLLKPGQIDLFNATPIAAVDVRYPLVSRDPGVTQVLEPIAQLYYRGSDTTDVGISNDNAQSFIFDDTNLFSYNRFSGTDRQETGLRANLGAHYQANFDNGAWLDLIGGQSFQLAGENAFAAADPTQVTTGKGLTSNASYMVFGAQGSFIPGLTLSSKLQLDPYAPRVTRYGIGGTYSVAGYDVALDYLYIAQDADRGVLKNQHEINVGTSMPLWDYWRGSAHAGWDIASNTWLDAGVGLHYDDGYLSYGADVSATGPTNIDPNDLRITGTLNLKGLGPLGN